MAMNWKDPIDGVIHIVDYQTTTDLWYGSTDSSRWMCCGRKVVVTKDGFVDQLVGSLHVSLVFVHTPNPATCLVCLTSEKHIPS